MNFTINAASCVDCHKKVTSNIVSDWQLSKHFQNDITCDVCRGSEHSSAKDVVKVKLPTLETCLQSYYQQAAQFKKGKHAIAWAAMKTMPTAHAQLVAMIEGMKGCGGCHELGVKNETEIKKLKDQGSVFGHASWDACHTRHTFRVKEARQLQACQTCHQGFDHLQWEMYSTSKHGTRYMLKQAGILPENAPAPTCQTCHMPDGNPQVRTAWGFLAVRLPMPEDKQWAVDRAEILKALGVLDPQGNPTALFDVVKATDVARLSQEDWQKERDKMTKVCSDCHSDNFTKSELEKGDDMIKKADHLMAEAIRIVAGLYNDGVIKKHNGYPYEFPMLLTLNDAPTVIEQKLFVMFLEQRMRSFQGTFHGNPDYALWYGWSELQRYLGEIRELAAEMRRNK